MKPFLRFLVFLLLASPLSHAGTLEDALVAAYHNNPALKSQRQSLKAADETASQAFSGWLPSASFTKARGREEGTIGTFSDSSTVDSEQWRVTQPLFRGGETVSQMKRAHGVVDSARQALHSTEQDVLLAAVTAYMDVVRDEKIYAISTHNRTLLDKHLAVSKDRFDLGEITRTDVAQSEARLSRAISDEIQAKGNLAASRAIYRRITLEEPVGLSLPKRIPELPKTLEDVIALAYKQNPLLLQSIAEEKVAHGDVNVFTSRILPSAAFNFVSRKDEGGISIVGRDLDTDQYTVDLTVPLYQSGAEYSRVRQAKHAESARKLFTQDIQNTLRQDAVQAWEGLNVAVTTIAASRDTVKAARSAFGGVQDEFDAGSRTTLDVLDAQQELFLAQTDFVRAQRNQMVAAYTLLSVMGELDAASLALPVDVYNPKQHYRAVRFKPFGLSAK